MMEAATEATRILPLMNTKNTGLTDEQAAMRRTGIGGSDIGALMGLSPWRGPLDVWRSKVEGWSLPDNPALRRGRILEPAVCQLYAEETGAALTTPGTLAHKKYGLMLATPDRIAHWPGETRLLEAKTSAHFNSEWGKPGTDQVPRAYLVQVVWTLAVAELEQADLAVLMGGQDLRIYRLHHDAELVGILREHAERFWRDYVVTKRPPPPDATEGYQDWLSERFPKDRAPLRDATPEEVALVAELRAAEERAEAHNTRVNELRNALRASIGEATGIQHPDFRVTWKATKDIQRTDWKAVAKEVASPALIEKHTETSPGSRRLLVRFTGEQS